MSLENNLQEIFQLTSRLTVSDSELNLAKENLKTTKHKFNLINVENNMIEIEKDKETESKEKSKKLVLANKSLEICIGHLYEHLIGLKNINKEHRSKIKILKDNLKALMKGKFMIYFV